MKQFEKIQRYPNGIVFAEQKKISALAKDIIAVAISQLEDDLKLNKDLFGGVAVTVTRKLISTIDPNMSRFKMALRELSDFTIILDDSGTTFDDLEYTLVKPFITVSYAKKELKLLIHSDIAKGFLDLKKDFSQIYIKDVLSLSSFRSKRLYEIMVGVKNFSVDKKRTFLDEDLKKILQITTNFKALKFEERYIVTNVEEINLKTGILVTYEREKTDVGQYSTTFTVVDKNKPNIEQKELVILPSFDNCNIAISEEQYSNFLRAIKEWQITTNYAITILSDHNLFQAFWSWRYLYQQKNEAEKKKIKSPGAVVLKHLGLLKQR